MKLLFFIHSLHSGGAERVTANLANHWAEKNWQITVVTLTARQDDFYQLHPAVDRVALDLAGESGNPFAAIGNNLKRILALRRVLRKVRPDVALAMMSTANVLLAIAASRLEGITALGSEHTHPPQMPLGLAWEALRARAYGRLAAVVALTEKSAAWLRRHTHARTAPVIHNAAPWPLPVQPPHLRPPARTERQRILLAVGRLSDEKGFDILIAVFRRLAEDFPDWRLVVLGEGPKRKTLEAQIAAVGLSQRVDLPGRAGNVGEWYAAADLYVMSSHFEGFPNTLAEALAHGLPAVSFDCDAGPRNIIRHERDGLLVPAGDSTALEAALRRLMDDEMLRRRFSRNAVDARIRFSLEKIAAQWESLFEALRLARQPGVARPSASVPLR